MGGVMNHLMLDIETMGTGVNAAIMSIGACFFDPDTSMIGDTFHTKVSLDSADNGDIEPSTVIWWLKQDNEARSQFYDNKDSLTLNCALNYLSMFLSSTPNGDLQVWGNGIAFDNVIVREACNRMGYDQPWDFWNDRDVRTMVELGRVIGIDPKNDMEFEGIKHDALSDAIHQAKYVSLIWQALTKNK
jgi:hypothetical protein